MKTVTLAPPLLGGPLDDATPALIGAPSTVAARGRLSAFVALTKPRIAVMVLVTVATGYVLGTVGSIDPVRMLLAMVGTALVAGGASVWNQVLERDRDARMRRTLSRPIPSGKVTPAEASAFGTAITILGLAMLALGANVLSSAVALVTFVLYVAVYTPLKPITSLNTAVGAIPGALPPVIGWAAASGRLGIEPWSLFLIVFLWQFPHFLAIAWIHREDYARGGHKMLPNLDPDGSMTGRQAMWHALVLLPAGLLPALSFVKLGGPWYFAGALLLGAYYLYHAVRFWLDVNDRTARRLLKASFLYLPTILLLLLLDRAA